MALGHACAFGGEEKGVLILLMLRRKEGRKEGRRISEYCPSERGKASIGVAKQRSAAFLFTCGGSALLRHSASVARPVVAV